MPEVPNRFEPDITTGRHDRDKSSMILICFVLVGDQLSRRFELDHLNDLLSYRTTFLVGGLGYQ